MKTILSSPRRLAGGILLVLLLTGQWALAQGDQLLIRLSGGYERQDFRWSIAGNSAGQDPNVYSELKWHAVSGPSGQVDLQWKPWRRRRWRVFAGGSRVFTRSGTLSDTDYGLDNRYDPIYHGQFPVTAGYSEAVAGGIGYSLLRNSRWSLTPFIGYGFDIQYFPVTDPGGPYEMLNSSYRAKWLGPLVRVEVSRQLGGRWQLVADVRYHQIRYHGTADWNLIPTFAQPVSFRHTADGYGIEAEAGLRYKASRRVAIELRGGYFNWETGTGIDQLYLSAGGADETQLNGVIRTGWRGAGSIEIGLF